MIRIIRLDTAIRIEKNVVLPGAKDADGFALEDWQSIHEGEAMCEWQNKFGGEAYKAAAMQAQEPASLKMWYVPGVTADCRIIRAEDGAVFEIIGSPDDVMNRHQQLAIEVKRYVRGR